MKTTHSPFTVGYSCGMAVTGVAIAVVGSIGNSMLFTLLLAGAIVISAMVFEFGGFIGGLFEKTRGKEKAA